MREMIILLTVFLLPLFINSGCDKETIPPVVQEDLDIVKDFNPENKYFKASLKSLHFIIETSGIDRVDTTFRMIMSSNKLPFTAAGCKDGTWRGESPYDAYDYKHVVKLEIKDEKIISIDYDEVKKGGIGKQGDEKYCQEMSQTGTTPAIAYPIYENSMLEKQDMTRIEAVTGATYSLYRFRYAVMLALMKAKM